MGNESSAHRVNVRQQQEQQRREHALEVQLLKAQEEARRKELEYQNKLALLKAQNEAKLKKQQQETLSKPIIDQNMTTASTSQYSVGSNNNSSVTEMTHSARAENSLYPQLSADLRRPRPSSHQRIRPAPTAPPYPLESQSLPSLTNLNRFICVTCNGSTYYKRGLTAFSCEDGHRSCKTCKVKNRRCGQCSQPITSRLNPGGGNVDGEITNEEVKCNKKRGMRSPAGNQNRYKELVFTCQGFNCDWIGQLSTLKSHYIEKHREKLVTVDSEISIPVNVDMSTPYLLNLGTFTFLFYVKTVNDNLYLFVQNIGSKRADEWNYEFQIYNKTKPNRKYTFTNVCLPSTTTVEQIINNQNCCILPRLGYIDTFVNNGILTIKVFVKRFQLKTR